MQFCPTCANVLLIEDGSSGLRFFCQTCPYIFNITSKVTKKLVLKHRPVETIDDSSWETMDTTDALCDKCGNNKAHFAQISTTVGENPRTFFRCANKLCKYRWNEKQ